MDQAIGRNSGILCVTPQDTGIGNTIAGLHTLHLGAYRGDHTRSFQSHDEGKGCWITAFAEIDVDKIHTRGFNLNDSLIRLGFWNRKVDERERFWSAHLRDLDGFHSRS